MDFDPSDGDPGCLRLLVKGKAIAAPGGPVTLLVNLRVGTDSGPFSRRFHGVAPNNQLKGNVDDLIVLGRADSAGDQNIGQQRRGGIRPALPAVSPMLPEQ